MLAGANGRHGRHGVNVIGRADRHRIDVPGLAIEHLTKILVPPRIGVRPKRPRGPLIIDIAQSDDIAPQPRQGRDVPAPHAARPDAGQVDRSLGGVCPCPPSTWRGTIVTPSAAPAAAPSSERREVVMLEERRVGCCDDILLSCGECVAS